MGVEQVRAGGLPSSKTSAIYKQLKHRKQIDEDGSNIRDEEQQWLHSLDPGLLTKAERLFRYLTIVKDKISTADRSTIRRLKSRY
jgi:hypothetical protein